MKITLEVPDELIEALAKDLDYFEVKDSEGNVTSDPSQHIINFFQDRVNASIKRVIYNEEQSKVNAEVTTKANQRFEALKSK